MAQLSISLLGSFHVALEGQPDANFVTDRTRALLAYLVVESGRAHRRDTLAGLLWPDYPQKKARQSLRQTLLYLRRAFDFLENGESFLLVDRNTVQFNLDSDCQLDVARFTALIADSKAHRHRRLEACRPCMGRLQEAAELYRGPFLEQFFLADSAAFEEWATLKREWLHRMAVGALLRLADCHENRGEIEQARQYAGWLVELEPWREEGRRQLMRLLALSGQRSAALAQYQACRRVLQDELGVEPTAETVALAEEIESVGERGYGGELLHPHTPTLPHPHTPTHNLPPSPTPFVGREAELAELAELLANPDCRLLTLVGPGGIGKTRLALKAAEDQIGAFADGVYFVSLASVDSAELMVPALAAAPGFGFYGSEAPQEQFLDYLREKEMLLALDNLEHLLPPSIPPAGGGEEGAVDLLAEILRRAPGVALLITSRERLNLQEEWVYQVEGLAYPTSEETLDGLQNYSAINLFAQSARRAHRFALSPAEAPCVVRICQLVEGIPLGIELAAAWVPAQGCREIAREIERNLDFLATSLRNVPARHRSLRATFEHSWQLLSEREKDLLARLSIFRGGFRPEAAGQVAGASPSALAALLDKSLIRRASSGRYDMHELLRQYAAEKLAADPRQCKETQLQHAHHFAVFLEGQKERLEGAEQKQALQEIGLEIENARRAWRLAVEHGRAHPVEQSLESLYRFYSAQCRYREGIDLFAQAIDRWSGDAQQEPVLGKVISRQGALYRYLSNYRPAKTCLERGLAIFKRLEMEGEQVFCLVKLASVARSQGKYQEAEQLARESLALSRRTGNSWGAASSLWLMGHVRYRVGEVGPAEALLEESLAIGRESGNQRLMLSPLNMLGDLACHRGDYDKAQSLFEECLALSRELGNQFHVAIHLNNLGTVLHVLEKYAGAKPFYQESLEICRQIGDRKGEAIALSNLGEVAFALGDYSEAREFYQEGLSIGRDIQDQWTIMACLHNLGETACALEDYQGARTCLVEAIEIATESQALPMLLKVLVNLAFLWAKEGQTGRAVELLGLALQHPASEQETKERAARLLAELPQPAEARSQARELDAVVAEILRDGGGWGSGPTLL